MTTERSIDNAWLTVTIAGHDHFFVIFRDSPTSGHYFVTDNQTRELLSPDPRSDGSLWSFVNGELRVSHNNVDWAVISPSDRPYDSAFYDAIEFELQLEKMLGQ